MADIIAQNKDSHLSYLKLEKQESGQFKIGTEDPLVTDFFVLNDDASESFNAGEAKEKKHSTDTPDVSRMTGIERESLDKDKTLCFRYG